MVKVAVIAGSHDGIMALVRCGYWLAQVLPSGLCTLFAHRVIGPVDSQFWSMQCLWSNP